MGCVYWPVPEGPAGVVCVLAYPRGPCWCGVCTGLSQRALLVWCVYWPAPEGSGVSMCRITCQAIAIFDLTCYVIGQTLLYVLGNKNTQKRLFISNWQLPQ